MPIIDSNDHRLPSTGTVLAFIVDCLGVPKQAEEYSYKELERLKKGGLATDKHWDVARKVMDAIVVSFVGTGAAQKLDAVLEQKTAGPVRRIHWNRQKGVLVPIPEFAAPLEAIYWKRNAAGELEDFAEVLLHDWTEFLFRHEFLANKCGSTEYPSLKSVVPWVCMFVVPFLAQNLIEYVRDDSQFERGMPGGRFWYLPQVIPPEDGNARNVRFRWPVNFVLDWWEDLLGVELKSHAESFFAPEVDLLNARRQIHAWQHENRPPDQVTIERWCRIDWSSRYTGVFVDDACLPLHERWQRCRAFLIRKGFHQTSDNWLNGIEGQPREVLQKQYRGEPLEREILPFQETSFAAFFESSDPIARGLPVQEMIKRVADRWSKPTNKQLRARLFMAAAFQRAFIKCMDSLGIHRALHILNCFQEVHCFLMDLNNQASNSSEIALLLRDTPEPQLSLRFMCEWLFDENSWLTLPDEMERLLKS